MRRLAPFVLIAVALLAGPPPATAEEPDPAALARRVLDPTARDELIRIGPAAVPHLLAQAAEGADRPAYESAATVRWIVWHWRDEPAARSTLVTQLGAFVRGPAPPANKTFAVDLLGDLGPEAVPTLEWALAWPAMAREAVLALERVPGEAARQALVDALELPDLAPGPILEAIGRRGEPASLPVLQAAAERDEPAAFGALAAYDEGRDWLLGEARSGSGMAFDALLERREIDGAILAALLEASDGERRRHVLARIERPSQHDPALVALLLDDEESLASEPERLAALLALGPALETSRAARVARAALALPPDRELTPAALRLCAEHCEATAASLMAPALRSADPDVRQAAIEALAAMPGAPASAEILLALDSGPSEALAESLVDALGERSDPAALEGLLDLVASAPAALEATVLEAARSMASRIEAPQARRLWAGSVDRRATEEALAGLTSSGGADDVERLEKVLDASAGALREAALTALVEVGRRLAADAAASESARVAAVDALTSAFDEGAAVEAELRWLGERIELVAHGGRIDAWWHATVEGADCATAPPPVAALEALDTTPLDTTRWEPRQSSDPRGAVILPPSRPAATSWLAADVLPRGDVATEITVLSSAPVTLWLAGTEELSPLAPVRGQSANEQRFAARLAEGPNRLVLRLCGSPEPFLLSVRLEDEEGRALKFRLR